MSSMLSTVVDVLMHDPVIVVMGIILLISVYADEIDRW